MNKKSRHPSVQEVAAQTARITVISNWFDDPRTSDNMGHFRTFQANPHNWKSADPLCVLALKCHCAFQITVLSLSKSTREVADVT